MSSIGFVNIFYQLPFNFLYFLNYHLGNPVAIVNGLWLIR